MALNKARSWQGDHRVPMNKLVMVRSALFSLALLIAFTNAVYCQTGLIPNSNATSQFQNRLTLQNEGDNAALTVHRGPLGKPCLNFEAASRRHVINPNVYDHVVSVYNRCVQIIKLRVCYYHSDHCIDMEVPGLQRKDAVLGIYPNMQYFRYSYREKN